MARRDTSIKYGGEDPSILPSNAVDTAPYVYSQCVDVYRLSNGNVTATRETVDFDTMSNYTNVQHLLVRVCGGSIPSDQEVRDYYGYTQVVQQVRCPARVRIVDNRNNNVVADNFNASCEIIEKYTNPNYTIMYLDDITTTTTPTPTTTTTPTPTTTTTPTPTPTPTTVHVPPPEETRCYMVHGQKLELTEQAVGYYINIGVTVTPCEAITDVTGQVTEVPTDFEYEDITTDHVPPPDIALDPSGGLPEVPIFVTPTEPSQVNWIPEPFFSFINSVFRK